LLGCDTIAHGEVGIFECTINRSGLDLSWTVNGANLNFLGSDLAGRIQSLDVDTSNTYAILSLVDNITDNISGEATKRVSFLHFEPYFNITGSIDIICSSTNLGECPKDVTIGELKTAIHAYLYECKMKWSSWA
jgi:hypothetical protein